jgi:hypothetical protein
MNIRPAVESEAPILSDLAMRAKAHWGYSPEALERWRPELSVSPKDVRERPTFVAMAGAEIVGSMRSRPRHAAAQVKSPSTPTQTLSRSI